jgi:hypothetical protein
MEASEAVEAYDAPASPASPENGEAKNRVESQVESGDIFDRLHTQPKKRGRPPGSKDKNPGARPSRRLNPSLPIQEDPQEEPTSPSEDLAES